MLIMLSCFDREFQLVWGLVEACARHNAQDCVMWHRAGEEPLTVIDRRKDVIRSRLQIG